MGLPEFAKDDCNLVKWRPIGVYGTTVTKFSFRWLHCSSLPARVCEWWLQFGQVKSDRGVWYYCNEVQFSVITLFLPTIYRPNQGNIFHGSQSWAKSSDEYYGCDSLFEATPMRCANGVHTIVRCIQDCFILVALVGIVISLQLVVIQQKWVALILLEWRKRRRSLCWRHSSLGLSSSLTGWWTLSFHGTINF